MVRFIFRLLLLPLALLLLCCLASPASAAGTKWAVLVGVDQYDNTNISTLQYAVADVKAVAQNLEQYEGFPTNQVFTMTSDIKEGRDRPSNDNVLARLGYLSELIQPEDTLLFYFAGHGFQPQDGSEFLGTVNANNENIYTLQISTIPLDLLKKQMKEVKANKVIFIIDACRNDPRKGRGDAANFQTQSFSRDLQEVAKASAGGAAGTAVLFACSDGQRSQEWPEKGHGAFTYYLLQGLAGQAAEPTGAITIHALGNYVQEQMRQWSLEHEVRQNPDLEQQGAAEIVLGQVPGGGGDIKPVETVAHLNIATDPAGAEVYVDGQDQGKTTPCTLDVELDVARTRQVEVAVKLEGYRALVRTVSLNRGATLPLSWPLQPGPQPITPVTPVRPDRKVNPRDSAEMVYVPAGPFTMGSSDYPDEKPQRQVTLDAYYIYKTPVTVGQYQKFCQATGHALPTAPNWGWKEDHPVVNVSWDDAKAYCDWAGVELPTEAQWEKAARGTEGRIYPWGDQWDASKLQQSAQSTAAVGSFPAGASPYGCLDMAGNVWQWCADWYDENYYQNAPAANPTGPQTGTARVLRGGSWGDFNQDYFRCSVRDGYLPDGGNDDFGFRCVARAGS